MMRAPTDGLTLALDAATYRGSVAVLDGARVLATRSAAMRGATEERLMPAVAAVLADAGVPARELARIVCGAGPGSFTSLRIAGAIAKGLALAGGAGAGAGGVPLYALPSALLVAAGAEPALPAGAYLVTLDAMRGDRFAALVQVGDGGAPMRLEGQRLAPAALLHDEARVHGWTVLGPDEARTLWPEASGVARLGHWLAEAAPVDPRSWEPDYGRLAEAQVKWEAAHGRPLLVR